jgi:hypothetical protein
MEVSDGGIPCTPRSFAIKATTDPALIPQGVGGTSRMAPRASECDSSRQEGEGRRSARARAEKWG